MHSMYAAIYGYLSYRDVIEWVCGQHFFLARLQITHDSNRTVDTAELLPPTLFKGKLLPLCEVEAEFTVLAQLFRGNRNQSLPSKYVHICRATKGSSFSDDISSAWNRWTLPVLGASARGQAPRGRV